MSVELFQVGGSVRDELMGLEPKDFDFTVVALGGFAEMKQWLLDQGFKIFVETPEYYTVRAHFPKGFTFAGKDVSRFTGDFVLARREGPYSDGRRPDWVRLGSLYGDLARRDFTINAIAKNKWGEIIDPFNGQADIETMTLRAVGSAKNRIREDALRALRAIRFCITKGFELDEELLQVLEAPWLPDLVAQISMDRKREELTKCFKHDGLLTMRVLSGEVKLYRAIVGDDMWFRPTTEKR